MNKIKSSVLLLFLHNVYRRVLITNILFNFSMNIYDQIFKYVPPITMYRVYSVQCTCHYNSGYHQRSMNRSDIFYVSMTSVTNWITRHVDSVFKQSEEEFASHPEVKWTMHCWTSPPTSKFSIRILPSRKTERFAFSEREGKIVLRISLFRENWGR